MAAAYAAYAYYYVYAWHLVCELQIDRFAYVVCILGVNFLAYPCECRLIATKVMQFNVKCIGRQRRRHGHSSCRACVPQKRKKEENFCAYMAKGYASTHTKCELNIEAGWSRECNTWRLAKQLQKLQIWWQHAANTAFCSTLLQAFAFTKRIHIFFFFFSVLFFVCFVFVYC